jgi:hypothetical protein
VHARLVSAANTAFNALIHHWDFRKGHTRDLIGELHGLRQNGLAEPGE